MGSRECSAGIQRSGVYPRRAVVKIGCKYVNYETICRYGLSNPKLSVVTIFWRMILSAAKEGPRKPGM